MIPEEKVYERWDTLPVVLKQALTSEVNSDFVWKTCELEHVSGKKIYEAGRAVSYVLLGFIHPGDLAQELKEALGVNPQIANSIANAINERVFKPLLADLEKIYEPPSAFAPVMISKTEPLKPVTEIKPPLLPFVKTEGPKPLAVQLGSPQETKIPATPPFSKPIGEMKPFTPTPSMPLGVSRAEKPPAPPTPSISPVPPGKPAAPIPGTPPPMILHEEPASAPLKKEFRLEMPQPKLSEIKLKSEVTKPAVLEFGPSTSNKRQATSDARAMMGDKGPASAEATAGRQTTNEKVRVVHYTEAPTPARKVPTPTAPSPGREIKEITAGEEQKIPPKTPFSGSDILKQLAAIRPAAPQANKPPETAQDKLPTSEVKPFTPPIGRTFDDMKKPAPPAMSRVELPTMSETKSPAPPAPRPRVEPPPIEKKPDAPKP